MMKVSELGEFGLIDLLSRMVAASQGKQPAPHQPVVGIGDDAAAWHSEASTHLATVDSLVQDVHFSLATMSWQELGWKSLAINLSDIAAMGGVPEYALVALALPEDTEVEDVAALYDGMIEIANKFNTAIIGGNMCRSPVVSITITVIGKSYHNELLRRSTARPGDAIAVTGYPGSAAAGLEILSNKPLLEPEAAKDFKDAFLRPVPRIAEGQILIRQSVTTAIDISDGLLSDLNHICKASGVGARVEVDRLPLKPALKEYLGDRALKLALSGGEDYEMLFTASADIIQRVKEEAKCPVTVIGEIIESKRHETSLFTADGSPVKINETGWRHF